VSYLFDCCVDGYIKTLYSYRVLSSGDVTPCWVVVVYKVSRNLRPLSSRLKSKPSKQNEISFHGELMHLQESNNECSSAGRFISEIPGSNMPTFLKLFMVFRSAYRRIHKQFPLQSLPFHRTQSFSLRRLPTLPCSTITSQFSQLSWISPGKYRGGTLKFMFRALPSIFFAVHYLPSSIHSARYILHIDNVVT
jgi:hypothetical protein